MSSRAVFSVAALLVLIATSCSDSTGGRQQATQTAAKTPETPLPPPEAIRDAIDTALDITEQRRLNSDDHAAWQVVHGIMAFGQGFHIEHQGQLVPALDWLLEGSSLSGWNMRPADHGLEAILEAGSQTGQGHEDQWLGYLSLCGLRANHPLVVRGQQHTVNDLVTQAQWDVHDGMEASWTLMGLSTYLPLDAKWQSSDGQTWDLERLVSLETEYPLGESPCGGTHRLIGLTIALNRYLSENDGKLQGAWQVADDEIQSAVERARENQNADGTFSAEFFERPSLTADVALKINTTGHTLEFLCYALPRDEIRSHECDWVARAALRLTELLDETSDLPLECGSLYHAAHALQLYRLQRFGPRVFETAPESAGAPQTVEQSQPAPAETAPSEAAPTETVPTEIAPTETGQATSASPAPAESATSEPASSEPVSSETAVSVSGATSPAPLASH
ncbi:MAG: hypothetical protein KDA63_18390 [Planctomycetales bacterium]|nr:hypothetical protein [Planctomycetales bacterium]